MSDSLIELKNLELTQLMRPVEAEIMTGHLGHFKAKMDRLNVQLETLFGMGHDIPWALEGVEVRLTPGVPEDLAIMVAGGEITAILDLNEATDGAVVNYSPEVKS